MHKHVHKLHTHTRIQRQRKTNKIAKSVNRAQGHYILLCALCVWIVVGVLVFLLLLLRAADVSLCVCVDGCFTTARLVCSNKIRDVRLYAYKGASRSVVMGFKGVVFGAKAIV